ncbi:MAG: SpoIVB peptidase S55 domain-containing protein, partial [Clostridia bacterium]
MKKFLLVISIMLISIFTVLPIATAITGECNADFWSKQTYIDSNNDETAQVLAEMPENLQLSSDSSDIDNNYVTRLSNLKDSDITAVGMPINNDLDVSISQQSPTVIDKVGEVLFGGKVTEIETVRLGGTPIGISLDSKGVKVIGISEVLTIDGMRCPAVEGDIRIGDVIIKVDGKEINSVAILSKITAESKGAILSIEFLRSGKAMSAKLTAALDLSTKKYKLGIWAKEGSSGIGTLTFVRENGQFGSLGHPIVNGETGEIYSISGGTIFDCEINGINKGSAGRAGELKGNFSEKVMGKVFKNNKFGVYGKMYKENCKNLDKISIIKAKDVKPGKAQIFTTINGKKPLLYDIEIIKAINQPIDNDKGIIIRITDSRLIEAAGGIVQGMSGSPIIQNNKLVGAVTHVFVNDCIKG